MDHIQNQKLKWGLVSTSSSIFKRDPTVQCRQGDPRFMWSRLFWASKSPNIYIKIPAFFVTKDSANICRRWRHVVVRVVFARITKYISEICITWLKYTIQGRKVCHVVYMISATPAPNCTLYYDDTTWLFDPGWVKTFRNGKQLFSYNCVKTLM